MTAVYVQSVPLNLSRLYLEIQQLNEAISELQFGSNMLCVCVWLLRLHGLQPTRLLWPWDSLGKNAGVGARSLLQRIFPTQESNPCLLHWQAEFFLTTEPCGRPMCCVNLAEWGKSSLRIQSGQGKCVDAASSGAGEFCILLGHCWGSSVESGHQQCVEPQLLLTSAVKDIHVWRQQIGHDLVEMGDLIFVGSSTDAHSGAEKSTFNFPSTSLFPPFMKP